ncbi:MAG TPA: sugar transferase [Sphingomonadaceae bacterium]|nr:sugar transferase [Sphingomonadaceae bacterium]
MSGHRQISDELRYVSNVAGENIAFISSNIIDDPFRDESSSGTKRLPFDAPLGRSLDILIAFCALLVMAPILVIIAVAIWAQDGGHPIFAHRRIGRGGLPFPCFKFRTMVVDADARLAHLLSTDAESAREWARDQKLRTDPRITPLGHFLRKSSLDEIPQLLNVLLGHMSLVGPRPIVESEVPRYGRYFSLYCQVRPGITGLWQVSGRNDVSYRRRVVLDTVYCRTKSVPFDLIILGKTVPAVLSRRGCT